MKLTEFIAKSGAVKIGIGFMISTQVMAFINELLAALVTPLVNRVVSSGEGHTRNMKFNVRGVELDIGRVIVAFIRILIHIAIVFGVVAILPSEITRFH